jgi:hypothetical protein
MTYHQEPSSFEDMIDGRQAMIVKIEIDNYLSK